jgi:RNA polymerase sigma factor (sigma-70 family)
MHDAPDMDLLRQYAGGNSDTAFAALVSRHVNLVYSAALRKAGNPHAAEEITQAVFIILAQKAGCIPDKTILPGWLYQTARLTAANFLKREIRRARREQEAYMQSQTDMARRSETETDETWQQLAPLLEDAMGQLGEKDRAAVLLRFFAGKSFAEVGTAASVSENAAKKRVTRALEKLRKFFMKRGIASTAETIAGAISANSVQAAPVALAKSVTTVAIAKGAAASGSTLTLVKGVLKLMAWTNTKTAIVAGVAVLLAAGTTIVTVKAVSAARTKAALAALQGDWEGTVTANQMQVRLVIKIFKTNNTYRALLDSVDQGAKDIPVTRLSARKDSIHAELPALDAVYQASLNADRTEMSGTWKQLKRSFPLTLKRTTEADRVAEAMAADEYAPQPDSDLQGAWEGSLKVGDAELRLALRIAEPRAGTFHAQMDSVDQGARNMPVTSLTYKKPAIRFEMTAINGAFEGSLNDRDDQMTGTWTQLGKKYPLTFRLAQANAQTTADEKDYGQGVSSQVQGHWKGAMDVNHVALRIVFHIALMPDDSYSATMDSPDQGVAGIPATAAQVTYPNVRLEWKAIGGVFTGKLENGRLSGTWRQGNVALPLKLERGAAQ